MGARQEDVQGRGYREALIAGGPVPSGDTKPLRDSIESLEAPESMPVAAAPVVAYVDGKRVNTLYVLLRHPMFLITEDSGTHETSRVYVTPKEIRIGDRQGNRLGPGVVSQVSFSRRDGLTVVTSRGHMHSPVTDCQVTWIPE
jgi:hypothetical protein